MKNERDNLYFEVQGAGEIRISKHCFHGCGTAWGFSFGVSWGRHGYTGGVLDREQAKKLADFIISEYEKVPIEKKYEEQKELIERDKMLKEIFGH